MLIEKKMHLTEKGLHQIIYFKSALNKGLPENLKVAFPSVSLLTRPVYTIPSIPFNPYWVTGFIDGDGSFTVYIEPETGYVNLRFLVGLNDRETSLIKKLLEFFGGVGRIDFHSNEVYYTIGNIKDLTIKIIPHFDTYVLEGNKYKNYLIWREIFLKVKSKSHLTTEGLNQIIELRKQLNKYTPSDGLLHSEQKNNISDSTLATEQEIMCVDDKEKLEAQSFVSEKPYEKLKFKPKPLMSSLKKKIGKSGNGRQFSTTAVSLTPLSSNSLIYFNTQIKTDKDLTSNKNFSAYLAGLIESDGTIAVHNKDSNTKIYNPKISVVFNLVDEPLAKKLASISNAGTIYKKQDAGHVL
jgi:hypothetical protein